MNNISDAFKGKKAFIPFITAGDPDLDTTEKLIKAMAEAGADLIEIGIPFSDPVAEGPVIQMANARAILSGCTTDKIFDMVERVRPSIHVPLVFMTYLNPVFSYGKDRFFKKCKKCGISGIIVPDMPFEEKGEILQACEQNDIALISLIAPTSKERIHMIAREAKGFLYCVSSLGVTGVRTEIKTDIKDMIKLVREVSEIPCAVGFGISTPSQAAEMSVCANGIIVGSAIVKIIDEYGSNSIEHASEYVRAMKNAIKDF